MFDNSTEQDAPRPRPRRSIWLPRVLVIIAVLLVGTLGLGTFYLAKVNQVVSSNLQRTQQMPEDTPSDGGSKRPAKPSGDSAKNAINYVLMGSDSRVESAPGDGRSDVLMVLHLTGDRKSAYVVSFPRDMYVDIPGHGKNKINAAFAFGGPQLTVRTLEGMLDVRMDHVALINFDGFIQLTEDLGGVTVYNRYPSVSQGYNFPKGYVTIRGAEALAYVRERHQLPHGDLDRAERQRVVLQAIIAKGLSPETIANPGRFLNFAEQVSQSVTVDGDLTPAVLRKTATSLRFTSTDDVHLLQAPISGFGTSPDKQSIDVVDQKRLTELSKALQDDTMDDYFARYPEG